MLGTCAPQLRWGLMLCLCSEKCHQEDMLTQQAVNTQSCSNLLLPDKTATGSTHLASSSPLLLPELSPEPLCCACFSASFLAFLAALRSLRSFLSRLSFFAFFSFLAGSPGSAASGLQQEKLTSALCCL